MNPAYAGFIIYNPYYNKLIYKKSFIDISRVILAIDLFE